MGCIHLSFDDFCNCTIDELDAIIKAWQEQRQEELQGAWERMRMEAFLIVSPKLKKRLTPKQFLSLPWDTKKKSYKSKSDDAPVLTKEESRARFEKLIQKHRHDGR